MQIVSYLRERLRVLQPTGYSAPSQLGAGHYLMLLHAVEMCCAGNRC